MRLALALVIAAGTLLGTAAFGQSSGVAVGAYVKDSDDPNGIASLEQQMCTRYKVCRVLALDYHYEKWAFSKLPDEAADITAGRTAVIAWTENSPDMPSATDIINGVYDVLLKEQGGYLYDLPNHATVMVEFIPELTDTDHSRLGTFYGNADWYKSASGIEAAGALYQQAQVHIVNILRKYASNAEFVFAPESGAYVTSVGGAPEWTWFYPGNATVDFVGADHRTADADLDSDKYFGEFYTQASSTGLPVMVTQICPAKSAADYIDSAITELPALFPAIVSFVYNDSKHGCPLEAQKGALSAFSSMAANSYFQRTF